MSYDWPPIEPHPTQPCLGGCGIHVDAADGLCRSCRRIRSGKPQDVSRFSEEWMRYQEQTGVPSDPLTIAAVAELDRRYPDRRKS